MIIRGAALALPGAADFRKAELRVAGGKIAALGESLAPERGEEVLDAAGLLLFPGAIDPHVHFDDPGFTEREDFLHGSMEAASGGVTTVIDMPCTSLPPVTTKAALEGKLSAIRGKAVVDYALYGGVSGNAVEAALGGGAEPGAMAELAPLVVGYKTYFISGMESFTRVTHADFPRVLAEAARLGRPLLLHAEDYDYVTAATARLAAGRAASGREPGWRDYLEARPRAAELAACAAALALAEEHAPSLHVVHVGTAAAARILAAAGASCETCAHYLAFTEADFGMRGAALKTAPPVKTERDRAGLWELLAGGEISFLASDHAPCPREEKEGRDPLAAYGGIPGTGTGFPWLLSEGLLARRLGLARFLEATSGAAARRYGLAGGKGSLEPGKDADLVLVDPEGRRVIRGGSLFSKGKVTPFEGMELRGRVLGTWLRGEMVYRVSRDAPADAAGEITARPGYGKFLTWGYR